jgi:hypothetical protein
MNKTMGGSYHNLAALADAKFSDARQVSHAKSPLGGGDGGGGSGGGGSSGGGGGGGAGMTQHSSSALSLDSQSGRSR